MSAPSPFAPTATSIAVVGSRAYPCPWEVRREVCRLARRIGPAFQLVSGGARGVDSWAAAEAERLGFRPLVYLPDFARYGAPGALFVRNTWIVAASHAVVAFWSGEHRGGCLRGGTMHTVRHALKQGRPVQFHVAPSAAPDAAFAAVSEFGAAVMLAG